MTSRVQIRFRKGNTVFHVYGGPFEGREGVHLAEGAVEGIYDAPVKTTWKTGAFQDGSRQKARKWLHRDMELGFHVGPTMGSSWEFNDSEFRRIFDYQDDPWEVDPTPTVLEVETELSGVRKLDVLLYDAPVFSPSIDPTKNSHGFVVLKLRAGQPFWYEDDIITEFAETTASAAGTITVSNPTDQVMYQKWVLTRATWTLPDVSWEGMAGVRAPGGEHETRVIDGIKVTDTNGGAVVDLDGQNLMFRDAHNTNLLAQMAGKFFVYPIPPYTPETELPVEYTDAPSGGAMVRLVQPRRWSRPWGMELAEAYAPDIARTQTIRFINPGTYAYRIPEWADAIDVILRPGGGGGGGGHLVTGQGGAAGTPVAVTLIRGEDIPWDTDRITGVVGAGGARGPAGNNLNGGPGGHSTAYALGMSPLIASGGTGSGNTGRVYGAPSPTVTLNGFTYKGGLEQSWPGNAGHVPGGGGAGGWPLGWGGAGARGEVIFRAYQLEGSS